MSEGIFLREVVDSDLPIFYEQQLDKDANYMAAFVHKDPSDREAFNAHWAKIRADARVVNRTILYDDLVAGNIARFEFFGEPNVSYWLGREFWGKGIATRALSLFLEELAERPIYGRAAADNLASIRVLEKCGFVRQRMERGFANARGEEIDEVVMVLP